MIQRLHEILSRFDEAERYETPSSFDYKGQMRRVENLQSDLENRFNLEFQLDDQVQDASFFSDLKIPKDLVSNPKPLLGYSIRISNFGRLATINFQDELTHTAVQGIIESLKKHDFQFLEADSLDVDYDGEFEEFKRISGNGTPTWYVRYFDYL